MTVELIGMSGGKGWTETVQQAIQHLDIRMQVAQDNIKQHEQALHELSEESVHMGNLVDPNKIEFTN